jgi:allantoicase
MTAPDPVPFTELPDLAVRALGGSVVYANDELYAERENLITAAPAVFAPATFGLKGQVYDGWETRRRREPGHDHAIVRLGAAGIIHGVVVDTSFFTGNYPPEVSVEATGAEGFPAPADLAGADWVMLVPRSPAKGDARNAFEVSDPHRYTHVRLSIYPDGGVARLRVHGEVVPDPRFLAGTLDLAAAENGGTITGCSDMFYSSAAHLIAPGRARTMGEGWENARRRDDGNDWVSVRLALPGRIRYAELDTSLFVGNAPGWARLSGSGPGSGFGSGGRMGPAPEAGPGPGADSGFGSGGRMGPAPEAGPGPGAGSGAGSGSGEEWFGLLPRTRLQPDTRHRFRLAGSPAVAAARLDVYPDGGMARLRLWGEADPAAHQAAAARWLDALPPAQAATVLTEAGLPAARATGIAAAAAGRWDMLPAPARAALTR